MAKSAERRVIDKVFILLGTAMMIVLLIVSYLAWYGYNFATTMVKTELSEQKIFFPEKDSSAITSLPAVDRAEMTKYAGQQLVDGEQAKVYANNFIKIHLEEIANGKTYAQISAESQKNPSDQKLQSQKATLFQGETLRGMLLGSGYAFWTFGMIAMYVSIAAFVGAVVMGLLVWLGLIHLARNRAW